MAKATKSTIAQEKEEEKKIFRSSGDVCRKAIRICNSSIFIGRMESPSGDYQTTPYRTSATELATDIVTADWKSWEVS